MTEKLEKIWLKVYPWYPKYLTSSDPWAKTIARFCKRASDSTFGTPILEGFYSNSYLWNLTLQGYVNFENTVPTTYGFSMSYTDIFDLELQTAELYHKTLKVFHAKIEAFKKNFMPHSPSTFGEYIFCCAKALKVEGVCINDKEFFWMGNKYHATIFSDQIDFFVSNLKPGG